MGFTPDALINSGVESLRTNSSFFGMFVQLIVVAIAFSFVQSKCVVAVAALAPLSSFSFIFYPSACGVASPGRVVSGKFWVVWFGLSLVCSLYVSTVSSTCTG